MASVQHTCDVETVLASLFANECEEALKWSATDGRPPCAVAAESQLPLTYRLSLRCVQATWQVEAGDHLGLDKEDVNGILDIFFEVYAPHTPWEPYNAVRAVGYNVIVPCSHASSL